ncbi:MAG TPA: glycine cleavage system aminomethyltransferase GcvT [Phycisphaerae bacterium]|nr:glycine cleavage system aminomethyltransferase GcvT [Phycisphaerae bacterium]
MKRTPLYDFHIQAGAKMVEFAGWEMPILYTGIVEEHNHTRTAASIFDVSHMGRLELRGTDAEALLQHVCTRQLGDAAVGQSRYSHICNEDGGILDDVIVSRYSDRWLVVCNASNRERIVDWLRQHAAGKDAQLTDTTEQTMMVALQGPKVMQILAVKLPIPLDDLKRYRFKSGDFMGIPYTIFRSGYTGEDGVEMILPGNVAPLLLPMVTDTMDAGLAIRPAGLGARDTLRLEAGMPLHGHELTESTDSISAGLAWCVDLKKDFIGASKLREVAAKGPARKLMGLELEGRRIARPGTTVSDGGRAVGEVTSGTLSPTLGRSIAMAYVDAAVAEPGHILNVDLGGKPNPAVVVSLPFCKR